MQFIHGDLLSIQNERKRVTMFRKTYLVLTLLLCFSLLMGASCAEEAAYVPAEQEDEPAGTDESTDANDQEKNLLEKLRTTVQMPDVYLIMYSIENEDGTVEFISYGRDESDRYYISKDGDEAL